MDCYRDYKLYLGLYFNKMCILAKKDGKWELLEIMGPGRYSDVLVSFPHYPIVPAIWIVCLWLGLAINRTSKDNY